MAKFRIQCVAKKNVERIVSQVKIHNFYLMFHCGRCI